MSGDKKIIMVIDDAATNLTRINEILEQDYDVRPCKTAKSALIFLTQFTPDLILLDIDMPDLNGYETIKILKEQPWTRDIPVVFLTAMDDNASEYLGLDLGAIDYISKPFSPLLLLKRIELHLLVESQRQKLQEYNDNLQEMVALKTQKVLRLQNTLLTTVAKLVEFRDDFTGHHVERTQRYLEIMVTSAIQNNLYHEQLQTWDMEMTLQSSQLHDVGKIAIRDSVLMKPGKLNAEEFEEMKEHVIRGVHFIEKMQEKEPDNDFLEQAKLFAGMHHEKWDGSGYPYALAKEDIPLQGRLMAIADVYDALTSRRPYKNALTHEEACDILMHGKGTHFDPALADLFEHNAEAFKSISQEKK